MSRMTLTALTLPLLVVACHDVTAPPQTVRAGVAEVGDARRLAVDAAGWEVPRLRLTVHGGPLDGGLEYEFEAKEGMPLVGAIDLPPGAGYAVEARGYDHEGQLVQAGKGELFVERELTPQVELVLEPVEDGQAWGRVRIGSLRLAASSHDITLKEGEPVRFDVGLVDADGVEQPLEPGTVRLDWPFPVGDPPKPEVVYEGWRAFVHWRESGVYGGTRLCIDGVACTDIQVYDGNHPLVISAGSQVTCVLRGLGGAKCWGADINGETGESQGVSQIGALGLVDVSAASRGGAGGVHVCGVDGQGGVWCWGRNTDGQLGVGTKSAAHVRQPVPQRVALPGTARQVATGAGHSCALLTDGRTFCWGDASLGQLGEGTYQSQYAGPIGNPSPVEVWTGARFTSIDAGDYHTCGVTAMGEMWCWGRNREEQLGVPTSSSVQCYASWWGYCNATPVRVAASVTFTSVAAGRFDTCGIASGGGAWCWGFQYYGNTSAAPQTHVPTQIGGGIAWADLSIGVSYKCGRDTSDRGACWGMNNGGQLGLGATSLDVFTPTAGSLDGGRQYFAVDAGDTHACGIRYERVVFCWGMDHFSRVLGYPNGGYSATPQPVTVRY